MQPNAGVNDVRYLYLMKDCGGRNGVALTEGSAVKRASWRCYGIASQSGNSQSSSCLVIR